MLEINDRQVIRRIKKGEIEYFSYIVNKYSNSIYRYIKRRLFDKEDVEDLVQNVFFNFYKAIGGFDEKRPVFTYLFAIVRNELKMYFRSHQKTIRLDERILIPTEDKLPPLEDLERLLNLLPQSQKKALKLLIEGYSYKEIAEKMGKPLNTVKTIIRRARLSIATYKNENA